MRLTQGMYGSQFDRKDSLFGLCCGQIRYPDDAAHNGGWYNQAGEKLGWGDLSQADVFRIGCELEPGEMFIVLSESDSFWNFVTKLGMVGPMHEVQPTAEAPGVEYVAKSCRYIILRGRVLWVQDERPGWARANSELHHITRDEARKLMLGGLQVMS